MTLHNADGSRAEMSGNGIRCFAQALAARRDSLAPQRIVTDAGERRVTLQSGALPGTLLATVEMGAVTPLERPGLHLPPGTPTPRFAFHLSLGNPHAVLGFDQVSAIDLAALGAANPDVNVEILQPGPGPGAITMRVHERGVGITPSCGTGACAAAFAARAQGHLDQMGAAITVHMDGGDAEVLFDAERSARLRLRGPTVHVATIALTLPG
jgi:diaminopimelate epimerase